MANILLTWELGGAMGHLLRMRAIGDALARRGHRVTFAVKDSARVGDLFGAAHISFIQAPVAQCKGPVGRLAGFADILAGIGFSDSDALTTLFKAWNDLFDQTKPDMVVTDYSPTALLALHGRPIRKVNVGLGLYIPPDVFPLPHWAAPGQSLPYSQLVADEQALTSKVNNLLIVHGRPTLQRLAQLFHQLDETILATYPELDPYGVRPHMRYWGHWQAGGGINPAWPQATGPKVYCYLKPFSGLEELLRQIQQAAVPTIVFAAGIDPGLQNRFSSLTMRFETHPLDVEKVVAQCDLAITHAGHGMVAAMLLGGIPSLWIPLFTEQQLNSQAAARVGAGRWVAPTDHAQLGPVLREMLTTTSYRQAAQRFSKKYTAQVPGAQIPEIIDRLERLLSSPAK